MVKPQEHLADWLRDAHAMEMQAIQMMETQVSRLDNYPELRARIQTHIEETRGQAGRLERCMERLGASRSALKDTAGRFVAVMQGLSGMIASDEVVKGGMFSYAFEHLEIAAYEILIEAARAVGDEETRRVCEENLEEEKRMAAWLSDNMGAVVQRYLERDLVGADAKR